MRVLVAMSGGVDSSVTAALMIEAGHEVVGATMKLWGGNSDSGCCSIADVEDARRVAQQLGIHHHVFNFTEEFHKTVVEKYVDAHASGLTPNPCVECNRHLKFDAFLDRAEILGFDAIATGHYARVVHNTAANRFELRRGSDPKKDQSYVLHMLDQKALSHTLLPIGALEKDVVRAKAAEIGLRTAAKPDSQDVCFIMATDGGRETFLGDRIPLRPGVIVDSGGARVGTVDSIELVTIGQRRGLNVPALDAERTGVADRRYAIDVDVPNGVVTVGTLDELMVSYQRVGDMSWSASSVAAGTEVLVQVSAHGAATKAAFDGHGVEFEVPQRRVAPGQMVVLYDADRVIGGAPAL